MAYEMNLHVREVTDRGERGLLAPRAAPRASAADSGTCGGSSG